jgi:hypothetical protein
VKIFNKVVRTASQIGSKVDALFGPFKVRRISAGGFYYGEDEINGRVNLISTRISNKRKTQKMEI